MCHGSQVKVDIVMRRWNCNVLGVYFAVDSSAFSVGL